MINMTGKLLVILNTALSLLFVGLAVAVYLNLVDLGWKEPRKEHGERIPAEIDKRVAAVRQAAVTTAVAEKEFRAAQGREPAAKGQPVLTPAESALQNVSLGLTRQLQDLYAVPDPHQVRYARLKNGTTVIAWVRRRSNLQNVHRLQLVDGRPVVYEDNPKAPWFGLPVVGPKVTLEYKDGDQSRTETINQPLLTYHARLRKIEEQINVIGKKLYQEGKEQKEITKAINTQIDDKTQQLLKPGLFDLLERENTLQKEIRREIDDIRPVWVQELVDAQLLLERRRELEARRDELKAKLAVPGK